MIKTLGIKIRRHRRALYLLLFFLVLSLIVFYMAFNNEFNVFDIHFDTTGGSHVSSVRVSLNDQIEVPNDPTRDGFIFNGWVIGDNEFNPQMKVRESTTLRALWLREGRTYYDIRLNLENGEDSRYLRVEEYNYMPIPITPQKEGSKFSHWALNNEQYDFKSAVVNSFTLVAVWDYNEAPLEYEDVVNAGVYCDRDYVSTEERCVRVQTMTARVECPAGFTLRDDRCVKIESETPKRLCERGMTDIDDTCYSYAKRPPEVIVDHVCDDGFFTRWDVVKREYYCLEKEGTIEPVYCPKGMVHMYGTDQCHEIIVAEDIMGTCRTGYSNYTQGYCVKDYYSKASVCSEKENFRLVEKTVAEKKQCNYFEIKPPNTYCPDQGAIKHNDKCFVSPVPKTLTCSYDFNLIGNTCIKETFNAQLYLCPAGYDVVAKRCIRETNNSPKYSCPAHYTLYGDKCYKVKE